jgi:hypothetical protein
LPIRKGEMMELMNNSTAFWAVENAIEEGILSANAERELDIALTGDILLPAKSTRQSRVKVLMSDLMSAWDAIAEQRR